MQDAEQLLQIDGLENNVSVCSLGRKEWLPEKS